MSMQGQLFHSCQWLCKVNSFIAAQEYIITEKRSLQGLPTESTG